MREAIVTVKKKRRSGDGLTAFFFLLPNIVGFFMFTAIPVLASLLISFYDWPIIGDMKFVGFNNYIRLFTKDALFVKVIGNTVFYAVIYVGLNIVIAMSLALWLTSRIHFANVYKSLFFIPQVTPIVATSLIWKWLYLPQFGLVNQFLGLLGIPDINWLGTMEWAMLGIIIMSVWQGFGYNMVLFTAGLYGIPHTIIEASIIDGAGSWKRFWKITLPLLSPTLFFAVVMTVISSFQVFDQTMIMTNGGPANSTNTIVLYLFQNGFTFFKMGYASSIAWVLFAIILVLTMIQMKLQKDWVYYE